MKTLLLALCLLGPANAVAQEWKTFVSPGIKFGYRFDQGFFAGMELSYTAMKTVGLIGGVAVGMDFMSKGTYKVHVGLEAGSIIGVQFGPTYETDEDGKGSWGYTTTVFSLAGIMPYYAYTIMRRDSYSEAGVYLKWGWQLTGDDIFDWH